MGINKIIKNKNTLLYLALIVLFVFLIWWLNSSSDSSSDNFDNLAPVDSRDLINGNEDVLESDILGQDSENDNQDSAKNSPKDILGNILKVVGIKSDNKADDKIEEEPNIVKPSGPVPLTEIMAWAYPGQPACNAMAELADGRRIDTVKVEYFRIKPGGELRFLTESTHGCNAYSEENLAFIKAYSRQQYVNVAAADAQDMNAFLLSDLASGEYSQRLVDFVVENSLTGVELDFEDFGSWDAAIYENYKVFVSQLGNKLRQQGKKLMIDGPATANQNEENWFVWRYADFISLPVDYIVVMAYDHQFDHGVGTPVAPLAWIEEVTQFTLGRFPDKSRLAIGLPSYGYRGRINTMSKTLLTYQQARQYAGFANAQRDEASAEMTWTHNNFQYFYQDSFSLDQKINVVLNQGIGRVSIWHLGGNQWTSL
ncbi:MAG: glycosyl hydrolase family 18 protein [Patescibacteria group bacterium]|nr:glycosyl hydrolase family 18 protein [Patescibacteria group bacterium]